MTMLRKYKMTTDGAINQSWRAPMGEWRLLMVTLTLSAEPTTGAQDYVVSIDNQDGATYDAVLQSTELVAAAATSVVLSPHGVIVLDGGSLNRPGDQLKLTFPNTDAVTAGAVAWIEKIG